MSEDPPPPRPARLSRRPPRTPWLGPLFFWELIRLARRGQDARARTILSIMLLATLFVFLMLWFPSTSISQLIFGTQQAVDIQESARFAEQFSLALLEAQMAVMVLLAPAYAAGSIAEEKERKTLANLLTTELSNRELVLGKYAARVVFLIGVMFAGLPILSLTGLVGGIDPLALVLSYMLTTTTIVMLSAIAICSAVYARTFRGAMFRAYGLTALYVLFGCGLHPVLSPFAVLFFLYSQRADLDLGMFVIGGGYGLLQILVAAGALVLAIRQIRKKTIHKPRMPRLPKARKLKEQEIVVVLQPDELVPIEVADGDDVPSAVAVKVPAAEPIRRHPQARVLSPREIKKQTQYILLDDIKKRPRVYENDPFYWKERYTLGTRRTADEESIRGLVMIVGVIVVTFITMISLLSFVIALAQNNANSNDAIARVLIMTGSCGMFLHLLTLGSAACQTVLRERQRVTLDSLLTIPVERSAILWPKWRIAISRGWWWGGPGMVAVLMGLLISRVDWTVIPAMVLLPAIALCSVSFGIWVSIRSTTTSRALMWFLSVAGGFLVIPMFVFWAFDQSTINWAVGIMTAAAILALSGSLGFWLRANRDFEAYGRN